MPSAPFPRLIWLIGTLIPFALIATGSSMFTNTRNVLLLFTEGGSNRRITKYKTHTPWFPNANCYPAIIDQVNPSNSHCDWTLILSFVLANMCLQIREKGVWSTTTIQTSRDQLVIYCLSYFTGHKQLVDLLCLICDGFLISFWTFFHLFSIILLLMLSKESRKLN